MPTHACRMHQLHPQTMCCSWPEALEDAGQYGANRWSGAVGILVQCDKQSHLAGAQGFRTQTLKQVCTCRHLWPVIEVTVVKGHDDVAETDLAHSHSCVSHVVEAAAQGHLHFSCVIQQSSVLIV